MLKHCAGERVAAPVGAQDATMSKTERAERQVRVQKLEAALAAMPADEEFNDDRERLRARVESVKKDAFESKPIGARTDAARAALLRAQARRAEAEKALMLATALCAESDAEIAVIQSDLEGLEAALAQPVKGPTQPCDVDQVTEMLTTLMSTLQANQFVDKEHFTLASECATRLVQGLQGTLAHASASEQAHAERHRIAGKQPPPHMKLNLDVKPMTRITGKTPVKRVISDYFAKSPAAKKSFRGTGEATINQ